MSQNGVRETSSHIEALVGRDVDVSAQKWLPKNGTACLEHMQRGEVCVAHAKRLRSTKQSGVIGEQRVDERTRMDGRPTSWRRPNCSKDDNKQTAAQILRQDRRGIKTEWTQHTEVRHIQLPIKEGKGQRMGDDGLGRRCS